MRSEITFFNNLVEKLLTAENQTPVIHPIPTEELNTSLNLEFNDE